MSTSIKKRGDSPITPETEEEPAKKIKPNQREHYVNNREFSKCIVEYVTSVKVAAIEAAEEPVPTEYIGLCLLKISEGLSRKQNFIRYTYREEMVMDGVENCLKAINNYNITVATRTGMPNAFAYFTQICYFAFLRRIAKEKKQQDIKALYIIHASIDSFANFSDEESGGGSSGGQAHLHTGGESIIERIRNKVERINQADHDVKAFGKTLKKHAAAAKVAAKIVNVPQESSILLVAEEPRAALRGNTKKSAASASSVEMFFN